MGCSCLAGGTPEDVQGRLRGGGRREGPTLTEEDESPLCRLCNVYQSGISRSGGYDAAFSRLISTDDIIGAADNIRPGIAGDGC